MHAYTLMRERESTHITHLHLNPYTVIATQYICRLESFRFVRLRWDCRQHYSTRYVCARRHYAICLNEMVSYV